MKLRLLLMDQYYSKMQRDYQFFIDYLRNRSNEFQHQKNSIKAYMDGIADGMKKERDFLQGTEVKEEEAPKDIVEEQYDIIITSKEEKEVVIGTKIVKGGNYSAEGAAIGMTAGFVAGGAIGAVATAPAGGWGCLIGAPVGAIAGGLLGSCIGSLIKKKDRTIQITEKETKYVSTLIKNGGKVRLTVDRPDPYDGLEHAVALRDIGDSMKKPIDDLLNEMQDKKQTAQQQMEGFKNLQSDVQKMLQNVDEFKLNVNAMKELLNGPNSVSDRYRKQLDKKWQQTSAKILGMLKSMEQTNNNQ